MSAGKTVDWDAILAEIASREDPVHWRLYLSPNTEHPTVICVHGFDYLDYDPLRFISSVRYDDEAEAEADCARIQHLFW